MEETRRVSALSGVGTVVAVTRGSAPCVPAPPPPRPPPRTPAETGLGQLSAELQRWPDAKCKCKLLWKPQQRRVPNPEQDLARGTSGSAPHIPPVSAVPRPQPRPTRCFFPPHPIRKWRGCRRLTERFPLLGPEPCQLLVASAVETRITKFLTIRGPTGNSQ